MVIFSKRMDGVAQDAIAEAIRLDNQEKLPGEQGDVEKP
jgi:hypothetical protein